LFVIINNYRKYLNKNNMVVMISLAVNLNKNRYILLKFTLKVNPKTTTFLSIFRFLFFSDKGFKNDYFNNKRLDKSAFLINYKIYNCVFISQKNEKNRIN
jgi:hypothetical protein